MLFGLLVTLFTFVCFFLVLIILVQQGKGGMGLGSIGCGTQMLFGGSGGQDIFQKITWILGAIFMIGSLVLAIMKTTGGTRGRLVGRAPVTQQAPARTGVPTSAPQQAPVQK